MPVYDENEVEIESIQAYAIRTDLTETASFECSDQRLNKLWQNTLWSQRGNMIAIPTDCPQRERAGFTGDVQIFIRAACINMDMRDFIRSWLRTVRLEQSSKGEVPVIAPDFPCIRAMQHAMCGINTSSGWGDAITIVPWEMYQMYGDITFLEENYEAMKNWLHFVTGWSQTGIPYPDGTEPVRKGHKQFLWDTGFHFGDWLVPSEASKGGSPLTWAESTKGPMGTAYYANSASLLAQTAEILGETEDSKYYYELAHNIRQAFAKEYYTGNGELTSNFQGVYVIALAFNMLPASERQLVADNLVKMIKKNGNCLDTGFLSVSHLMDALSNFGYENVALDLLFQTKCPSWLYEVESGATTIWERWTAITPEGEVTNSSFNHYAFGVVIDWIMRKIAGINPLSSGYRTLEFAPMLNCGLKFASGSYNSIYGKIAISWQIIEDKKIQITTEVPMGVTATLNVNGVKTELPYGLNKTDIMIF
jgi:alpha-L-rhamnosidase